MFGNILTLTSLFLGSPTDHSPVLNLSKSGGGSAGSLGDGDHSGSEADGPDAPPSPRSPRSAAEDDEEDNISDPDDEDDKDQGRSKFQTWIQYSYWIEWLENIVKV